MTDSGEAGFQRALEAEKLEAMAEFAAGAGHEINNPLTVISGRAQLLLRDETDPERQHALALISTQAMRVYEMIADMMLFARPPRPELQPLDLIKLIDELVADFLPRCSHQETAIHRSGEPGPIVIEADSVQLGVALRAICQNSIEALQSGGHIEIAVEKGSELFSTQQPSAGCRVGQANLCSGGASVAATRPALSQSDEQELDGLRSPTTDLRDLDPPYGEPCVKISIRDDGPGIRPEERRHLFDPFYSARQAGRGLGLGLSKAWRIITNHGGRIDVSSEPGHGATFIVSLPSRSHEPSKTNSH